MRRKILVFGMTYPELSTRHIETVCTAGVLDTGEPVRLYPVPYRYLNGDAQFQKYQWIEADIRKNTSDTRPESYKVDTASIVMGPLLQAKANGWSARADVIMRNPHWIFTSMEDVQKAHVDRGLSLALVKPTAILDVAIVDRPEDDELSYLQKLEGLRLRKEIDDDQFKLFASSSVMPEVKDLHFPKSRLQIHWKCSAPSCGSLHSVHKMQVLDWEAAEVQRKFGIQKAKEMLIDILDPDERDVRFFLGNLYTHPSAFMIGGIWRPKIVSEPDLFHQVSND